MTTAEQKLADQANNAVETTPANASTEQPVVEPIGYSDDEERTLAYINAKSRNIIDSEGKYSVKVTGVQPYTRPDGTRVMICNFQAMTDKQLNEALDSFDAGDLQKASNIGLNTNLRVGIDWIPEKGEFVNIQTVLRPTKERTDSDGVVTPAGQDYFVGTVSFQPPVVARSVSASDMIKARREARANG